MAAARRDIEVVLNAKPLCAPALLRFGQVLKADNAILAARPVFNSGAQLPESAVLAHLELNFGYGVSNRASIIWTRPSPARSSLPSSNTCKINALASQNENTCQPANL